ncbi:MAG: peptidylprolyl isomerase [Deltaproteobacteria bacterium]|nr:peptidylprolyl isomerase [Deltaproteobacteria bacterium]
MSLQIGRDVFVRVHYDLRDGRGNILETTDEPAEFVWGYNTLLPSLELAIEGMVSGDVVNVSLEPEDAYGTRDEDGVFAVAREEFPENVPLEIDNEYTAESDDGSSITMRVIELHDDHVLVDTNHPLAGETLNFNVQVLDVRAATEDEILAARAEASEVGEQYADVTDAMPS